MIISKDGYDNENVSFHLFVYITHFLKLALNGVDVYLDLMLHSTTKVIRRLQN